MAIQRDGRYDTMDRVVSDLCRGVCNRIPLPRFFQPIVVNLLVNLKVVVTVTEETPYRWASLDQGFEKFLIFTTIHQCKNSEIFLKTLEFVLLQYGPQPGHCDNAPNALVVFKWLNRVALKS